MHLVGPVTTSQLGLHPIQVKANINGLAQDSRGGVETKARYSIVTYTNLKPNPHRGP